MRNALNGHLVLSSSLLAGLELFEVPATDGHVALVLVHAVGEALNVGGARTGSFGGRTLAVQSIVHRISGLCVGIGGLLLLLDRGRGAASEESADGVAN